MLRFFDVFKLYSSSIFLLLIKFRLFVSKRVFFVFLNVVILVLGCVCVVLCCVRFVYVWDGNINYDVFGLVFVWFEGVVYIYLFCCVRFLLLGG